MVINIKDGRVPASLIMQLAQYQWHQWKRTAI